MEVSVEQIPACASRASVSQLNHPSIPEPHRLRQQPSEPHATRGPFHRAGVGHRACAVARPNEYSDKGKGARSGRCGNEKGHAQSDAGAPTYSPPPGPGSHLKPRQAWIAPAVSLSVPATTPAPASSSLRPVAATAPRLLLPERSPPQPSNPFIPRRSNRVVLHQKTFIFNHPYFYPLAPPTPNYFHGFTPIYHPYNHYYSLISSAMDFSSPMSSPTQSNKPPPLVYQKGPLQTQCTPARKPSFVHRKRLEEKYRELQLPAPEYHYMSDRRGCRTAWSCKVVVGNSSVIARYWYDGIDNAAEDAAEVIYKIIVDYEKNGESLRRPSLPLANNPGHIPTFPPSNYPYSTHNNYSHNSPLQGGSGGGHGFGTIGGGIGPGPRSTHSHSQSHESVDVRGKPYVSNSFGA
ncbi:hypothetical protein BDD12DRAFT_275353 [Trichophaea hybrida]|nr:hypothetical protein BDD12DRAFT_275353 [Trichophaea hybrida]